MLPPPIHPSVDMRDATTWVPPGHEPVPCVPPPPDDRFEVVRWWLLDAYARRLSHAARHLLAHAAPADTAAWEALGRDLDDARDCDSAWRVAAALARGDVDGAVAGAALVCGEDGATWLRETRALARKGGAR